ncbi:MAG: peptide ABC transporter substrate-binding protein [Chloroflexota bacterium]
MKRTTKHILIPLVTLVALLACSLSGTQTNPGSTPGSQMTTPTRPAPPTATLSPNTFYSPEAGVRAPYPRGWRLDPPEDESNLTIFVSPDSRIFAYLYVFPIEDEDLETAATGIRTTAMEGLVNITVLEDTAIELVIGAPAWWSIATGVIPDDTLELKISMLTVFYGPRMYFLMTYGTTAAYDYYADDVLEIVHALQFEAPVIYDVPRDLALFLSGGESTNPREHDPATTHGSGDKRVFSGLVSFDPSLNLVAELAESWDVSPDGTVYTFHLRSNARFHDSSQVTAQDVIYSWERAADPDTQSDTVLTYLGDIVGVVEMSSGLADHISGLQALDDLTLQVTIDAPKPYFLMKLTYPTAFVVDRGNVESGPEWYRTPNGTGPYKLIRWERFEVKIYHANQDYYLGPPAIQYVVVQIYSGVGIRLYESGEIDIAAVSSYDVPRVLDVEGPLHTEVHSAVNLCTYYIIFDVAQPPFDDVNVRQAFSMAFDRQKYIDVVYNGIGLPASGLYPPSLPGYNLDLQGLAYNPERARQLLAESRYGGPQGLPAIIFTDAGIGNDAGASSAALAQMWRQNLGVEITIENLEPDRYYDLLYSGAHGQLLDTGWCADYPDPENFADVLFHSGTQQNLGNYSNPEYDALLDQARVEQNIQLRIQLYQQAEQILVNDAPALFILHPLTYVLVKSHIQGFTLTPIDISLERYMWLEPGP